MQQHAIARSSFSIETLLANDDVIASADNDDVIARHRLKNGSNESTTDNDAVRLNGAYERVTCSPLALPVADTVVDQAEVLESITNGSLGRPNSTSSQVQPSSPETGRPNTSHLTVTGYGSFASQPPFSHFTHCFPSTSAVETLVALERRQSLRSTSMIEAPSADVAACLGSSSDSSSVTSSGWYWQQQNQSVAGDAGVAAADGMQASSEMLLQLQRYRQLAAIRQMMFAPAALYRSAGLSDMYGLHQPVSASCHGGESGVSATLAW